MFDGFEPTMIETSEAAIRVRHGGGGPPVLLLHGFPQTHIMWHKIAPGLAREFTVVAADLRGYGGSSKPLTTADHEPYSKRAMARDMVAVMDRLGFNRFSVVGHDRGGRVAYRLALDHPARVERLAVLDIVPVSEAFRRADMAFVLNFWPWSLLAQPYPLPERLVGGAPEAVLEAALDGWSVVPGAFPDEVRTEYRHALADPETIHAICEEYRAASTLDFEQDEADQREGRRINCPVLVLWSEHGALQKRYDTLGLWRGWADNVGGRPLDCGHFLPEEAPDQTYAALRAFLMGTDEATTS
jgi:haloacetate dehalogenase